MSKLLVCVLQGTKHPEDQEVAAMDADNALDIPASNETQQWTIWKEIAEGFENDKQWRLDSRQHGWVRFRHTLMHTYCTDVFTTLVPDNDVL